MAPQTAKIIFRGTMVQDFFLAGRVHKRGLPPGVDGADPYLSDNWNMVAVVILLPSTSGIVEIQRYMLSWVSRFKVQENSNGDTSGSGDSSGTLSPGKG